jgi:UDP-N-acetyl-D-galactosamine dehydrogenase
VLVHGFAFKENCPDLRNTRVIDIVRDLKKSMANVDVYDPWVDNEECAREYDVRTIEAIEEGVYDAVIIAVAHDEFRSFGPEKIRAFGKPGAVVYDVKSVLPQESVDGRL